MQIKVEAVGRNGRFACGLGEFVAFHEGAGERSGEFVAEIDTDEVFVPGETLFVLDEPMPPSISIVGGANVMVGCVSGGFENQTAVLEMNDARLIFEYSGELETGKWVSMRSGPFTVLPVNA